MSEKSYCGKRREANSLPGIILRSHSMNDLFKIAEETQDVVVVGAGAAGLSAAISAAEKGARVSVLEKAADLKRTNTSRSGGFISIAMERELDSHAKRLSPKAKMEEAMAITGGRIDPDLVLAWAENVDDTVEWLEKIGIKWTPSPIGIPREAGVATLGAGAGLNKLLLSAARERGVKVYFQTKALRLHTSSSGEVNGVLARSPEGSPMLFLANATVLATAGFQANQEMLLKYFGPSFTYNVRLTGSPVSTGDGILMAQEAGAQLMNMDQFHSRNIDDSWVPGSSGMWGPVRELQTLCHYGIFVNSLGKRFMDEADTSDIIAASIIRQPEGWISILWDEKIKELVPAEVQNYRPPEMVIRSMTIEELADKIRVPSDVLEETLSEFNRAADGDKASKLDIPKRAFARRIENPPYYAVSPVRCGLNCTLGGVKINSKAQVIDRDNRPIPGLFASGEMIGGFFFGRYFQTRQGATYYKGNYQVTAASLSVCIVFGRIAGGNSVLCNLC